MRRIFVSLIVLGMGFGSLGECRSISEEEAKLVAEQWISYIVETEGNWEGSTTPLIEQIEKLERDGLLLGYNIDVSPSGYILVPNETELPPVKSYSTKSHFDQTSLGYEYCIIAELLEVIKFIQERSKLRLPPVILSPSNQKAWDWLIKLQKGRFLASSVQTLSANPLLKTEWNQGDPYNQLCPQVNGQRTLAGCVAVATGQTMKYWNHPPKGTGSYSYNWNSQNLEADFSDEYDWNNMPSSLSWFSSQTQKDAVSELLYEVGVAYEMNYGTNGSGADMDSAIDILPKYFYYSKEIKKINRIGFANDDEWFNKFKEERDILRPVLFTIYGTETKSTKTIGHAVVVDGYRQITQNSTLVNQIHINMGWSGSHDDYYTLNNIVIPNQYYFTFINDQYAVIKIFPRGITAGLVIDRSGSMDEADKLPKAKEAAKYFVDASEAGDEIAISAFDDNPLLVASLTEITKTDPINNPIKDSLKSAINTLTPGNMTNFGAGLSTVYNELAKSTNNQTTFCLFMSDGWHNTGSYNNEVNAFKAKSWPIYTVGFGDGADENTLKQIASDTGGSYYYAPAISLVGIYHLITGKVKGESFLAAFTGFISYLQTITHLSLIDKTVENAKFVLGWTGSEMDMVLIAPDGTEITPDTAATNPDIEYYKGDTYVYYTVKNPIPGEWKAKVIGTDIPTPEQYTLTISGVSSLISNTPGFKSSYNLGETVNIALSLEEITSTQTVIPITEAVVSAKTTKPDASWETLTLYDDGIHSDGSANDGLYANNYNNTNLNGFYQIEITALGTYSQGTFTRQLKEIIQVGILTPPPPQDFTPPTTPGTPTENFPDIDIGIGTYTVHWQPATDTESGIAFYEIQEKINQENWQTIGSTTGTSTIISNKQAGNTYYYRIRAMNTFNLYGSYSAASDGIRIVDQLFQISPNTSYILTLGGARIEILPFTFAETITFTMSNLPIPTQQSFPKIVSFLQDRAVEFLALNSNNQQIQPINNIRITLSYNDPNPSNEEEDLNYRIFRLNETLNRWEEVLTNQQIDAANNTISILISSLSLYISINPSLAASTLANVHVYPNPCKGDKTVKFKNLTENAKIQIYTIAGQLVDEIEIKNNVTGAVEWDCRNSSGKKVASGIYIYLITNDKGEKVSGKISLIK